MTAAAPARAAVWRALARKAWLETRTRFATGTIVIVALCAFMVLVRPRMLVQWPLDKIQHPEWHDPPWWDRVHTDYAFFLWHYLYRDMLQKAFMVFAVLLGVGGLAREAAQGTAGFTLSLPVSRRTLLAARALVGAAEIVALGAVAAVTILLVSFAIGVPYSPSHAIVHNGLVAVGALVLLAGSLCVSSVVEGEHAPALVGLAAVGMFNYVMAPYADGGPTSGMVKALDFVHVMAGGAGATIGDIPWMGLAISLLVGAIAMHVAFHRSAIHDF
jgi:ABC-2 type transport system permease protein